MAWLRRQSEEWKAFPLPNRSHRLPFPVCTLVKWHIFPGLSTASQFHLINNSPAVIFQKWVSIIAFWFLVSVLYIFPQRSKHHSPFSIILEISLPVKPGHLFVIPFSPHWIDLCFLSKIGSNCNIGAQHSHLYKICPDNKFVDYIALPLNRIAAWGNCLQLFFFGNPTLGSGLLSVGFGDLTKQEKTESDGACLCSGFARQPQSSYQVLSLGLLIHGRMPPVYYDACAIIFRSKRVEVHDT